MKKRKIQRNVRRTCSVSNMSTHRRSFTRPRTIYATRYGYYRTPMVRRYARKPRVNKVSVFQDIGTGPEYKNLDTAVPALALAAGGATVQQCTTMAIGAGVGNALGRRVTFKTLVVRCVTNAPIVRVLIVYDKQSNGALPLAGDVLQAGNFTSPMNLNNSERFIILMDRIYSQGEDGASTSAALGGAAQGHYYRKIALEGIVPQAGGTLITGNISAIIMNPDTAAHTMDFYCRLRFIDA